MNPDIYWMAAAVVLTGAMLVIGAVGTFLRSRGHL
jgi:hypothetical protein